MGWSGETVAQRAQGTGGTGSGGAGHDGCDSSSGDTDTTARTTSAARCHHRTSALGDLSGHRRPKCLPRAKVKGAHNVHGRHAATGGRRLLQEASVAALAHSSRAAPQQR
jgi:hypothetical protein